MDISQLIESIDSATSSGNLQTIDPQQRAQLFEACNRLKGQVESPLDKTLGLLYTVIWKL
jgi:hypothetical protein